MQNIVSINNSRTAYPTNLMPSFSFSDNVFDAYIIYIRWCKSGGGQSTRPLPFLPDFFSFSWFLLFSRFSPSFPRFFFFFFFFLLFLANFSLLGGTLQRHWLSLLNILSRGLEYPLAPKVQYPYKFRLKGAWNYAYLAHKIQNFLKHVPLQTPKSYMGLRINFNGIGT